MDALKIIAILQQLAALGATVADLVADARENFASEDEAKLKAALDELEGRNNASYARVRDKLAKASGQG
jgi:ABC-type transporter Mla subunit MlaD